MNSVELVSNSKRQIVKCDGFTFVYIPLEFTEALKYGHGMVNPCWRIRIDDSEINSNPEFELSQNERELMSKSIEYLQTQYPSVTSADLQTAVIAIQKFIELYRQ